MKQLQIAFSLLLVYVFLAACGSKDRVEVPKKALPKWYSQPLQSNETTLYSVGGGENKQEAIANALNAMIATLSVSISSDFYLKNSVREGLVDSFQSDSESSIRMQVQKVRLSDYQVIHAQEYGFENYIVALQANKRNIFLSLLKEMEQKIGIIQIKNQESLGLNVLKQVSTSKLALREIPEIRNTLIVLNSLNTDFDSSQYVQSLLEIENRYTMLVDSVSFSVDERGDAMNLIPVLEKGLTAQNYVVTKATQDENHFRVYLHSSIQYAKSYGFDLARSAISIKVLDNNDKVVSSNKLNITGQSTQGYEVAKENIALKLNRILEQDGMNSIINLDL